MLKRMFPKRLLGKTGYEVSSLGIGGCTIGHLYNAFDAPSHTESFEMVKYALDHGVNFIDTAPLYGNSEDEFGKILKKLDTEKIHARNAYHLCTKIGRYDWKEFDYSTKKTKMSIEESLNRLQTDYIDIIHVHDFELTDNGLAQIYNETLPFLYELKNSQDSVIKNIGISGQQLVVLDYVAKKFGFDKIDTILTYNNANIPDVRLMNYTNFIIWMIHLHCTLC